MAATQAQEAAAKERIIKHMNADHQDSIRRYVVHRGVSAFAARDASLTSISAQKMDIAYGGKTTSIAFDPPMKSMREARERLVQLDKDALEALDLSDITIDSYIPPTANLLSLANFSVCLLTYIVFSSSSNFEPGSPLYDHFLVNFPTAAAFFAKIQLLLMSIMVSIHLFECSLMIKKLNKHSVVPFTKVWWTWVASTFVEGVTAFKRMDGLIEDKTKEKESKKH